MNKGLINLIRGRFLNAFTKYIYPKLTKKGEKMVRVITIRDDVYAELYRLKKSKGMSFSQIIEYLINEKQEKTKDVLSFAGSISREDVDSRGLEGIKREEESWRR